MAGGILSLSCSPIVGSRVPVDAHSWVERFGGELNVSAFAFSVLLLSEDRVLCLPEVAGDGKGVRMANPAGLLRMVCRQFYGVA